MSYEKLGFTSGQTLKAEHLNHMEEGIANAGGVSSWNDLQDKPFYSEMVEGIAEFDGDLTGKECLDAGGGVSFVKITENTVTLEQLIGSTVVVKAPDGHDDITLEITEDMIQVQTATETAGVMNVGHDGMPLMFVAYGDMAAEGAPFSDGTYFMYQLIDDSAAYTRSLSFVHKIDEKYLPDSVKKSKGATVYYCDNIYLYHDSMLTNKVTKEELRTASQRGVVYVNTWDWEGVTNLQLALQVYVDDGKGCISFLMENTMWRALYTAEYEPPTEN